jgi:hypothetical protein
MQSWKVGDTWDGCAWHGRLIILLSLYFTYSGLKFITLYELSPGIKLSLGLRLEPYAETRMQQQAIWKKFPVGTPHPHFKLVWCTGRSSLVFIAISRQWRDRLTERQTLIYRHRLFPTSSSIEPPPPCKPLSLALIMNGSPFANMSTVRC